MNGLAQIYSSWITRFHVDGLKDITLDDGIIMILPQIGRLQTRAGRRAAQHEWTAR